MVECTRGGGSETGGGGSKPIANIIFYISSPKKAQNTTWMGCMAIGHKTKVKYRNKMLESRTKTQILWWRIGNLEKWVNVENCTSAAVPASAEALIRACTAVIESKARAKRPQMAFYLCMLTQ